ncbi:MAG TPA: polysaccharide biosynthesis/export family protein [Edaphobacter sp.]|nr:polysaccharide biosynthesis/export family protein [Edaphobacter sp.]
MRQRHNNLGRAVEVKWPTNWRCAWLILAMLVVMGLSSRAMAQFSGPALGISTPINPPYKITTDPAILFPANRDVYLWHDDLITIHIFGSLEYAPTVRVGLDGTIQLPLIGSVQVEGLTLHQAQTLIAQKLISAGMYRDPQVTIQITESPNQTATVIGELHGVVAIIGERRLYDVLAAVGSGGFTSTATTVVLGGGGLPTTASHIITINRPGVEEPITVDLGTNPEKSAEANIPIFPRDTIIVPRVGVIYLLGAFKNQGAVPLTQNSPMTLMKVAALTGGSGFEGKQSDLRIIRSVGTSRQVIRVDLSKVVKGQAPDPVLEAEDIVFLPTNAMKAAIKSGGIGTLLSIVSVLLIAVQL